MITPARPLPWQPSMEARGRVPSVSSLIGFEMPSTPSPSKNGSVGLTRALPHEVGPEGIAVNPIAPDAFPTHVEKMHPLSITGQTVAIGCGRAIHWSLVR